MPLSGQALTLTELAAIAGGVARLGVVVRRADAGYEEAVGFAKEHDIARPG